MGAERSVRGWVYSIFFFEQRTDEEVNETGKVLLGRMNGEQSVRERERENRAEPRN